VAHIEVGVGMPYLIPMSSPLSENNQRYVTAHVLAAKYRVTSRYILQLATAGKIPALRIGKKCVRFCPDAVAKAIGDK
jgi:hypothetical protein